MKLTYEMAEKIFDMKKAGKSIKEISEELGVSDQTVRNRLKSAEEAKAEPEPEEAPAREEETPETLPELGMAVERFRLIGTVADYVVDRDELEIEPKMSDLDSVINVNALPEFIRELQAVVKKLEQGV